MKKTSPIGIFDSGVGGITIWQEVVNQLPNEDSIYLADNKNAPYGFKSRAEVLAYSIKNTKYLLSRNVKLVVVACNTATTIAIDTLREKFPHICFIGVEPAIKPAAILSIKKHIAVLATYNTLHSKEFSRAIKMPYMNNIKLTQIVGKGLVPLIEQNKLDSPQMQSLLHNYTQEMIAADIDQLVLGCTHYPYIKSALQNKLPKHINIIDSGQAVAKQTKYILQTNNLLNEQSDLGHHEFLYNKHSENMKEFLPENERSSLILLDF